MKLKAVIFKELLADHDRQEAEIAKLKAEAVDPALFEAWMNRAESAEQYNGKMYEKLGILQAEIVKFKEENSELRDGSPVKPQTTKE